MNCTQARLAIGAAPLVADEALEEHVRSCADCARFREETRALDADIRRALEQPPALAATSRRRGVQTGLGRQWALAAGIVLAVAAVLGVWLLRPGETLAHEVVAHVQAEPQSWLSTHVTRDEMDTALRGSGVALGLNSDKISYARSCWFRGYYVPHLVVQSTQGPATVLILRHEHVLVSRSFHEAGMSGVIVPVGAGSMAVLARDGSNPKAIAGRLRHDVRWLPEPR